MPTSPILRRPTWSIAVPAALAALAVIPLFGGCRDSTGPAAPPELLPLAAGTEWTYERVDSVEFGTGSGLAPHTFVVRVRRDTVLKGHNWAVVEGGVELLDDYDADRPTYLTNGRGGLWRTDGSITTWPFSIPPGEFYDLVLPYPVQAGNAANWHVVSTDTVITVPAGTFHCVRYDAWESVPEGHTTYFVAPGIGIVKKVLGLSLAYDQTWRVVTQRWRFVYQLTAYDIASPPR